MAQGYWMDERNRTRPTLPVFSDYETEPMLAPPPEVTVDEYGRATIPAGGLQGQFEGREPTLIQQYGELPEKVARAFGQQLMQDPLSALAMPGAGIVGAGGKAAKAGTGLHPLAGIRPGKRYMGENPKHLWKQMEKDKQFLDEQTKKALAQHKVDIGTIKAEPYPHSYPSPEATRYFDNIERELERSGTTRAVMERMKPHLKYYEGAAERWKAQQPRGQTLPQAVKSVFGKQKPYEGVYIVEP